MDDPVVHQYMVKIIGEDGVAILGRLPAGEIVDEVVSADTGMDINVIRKTLFKLYENRLASYRRERNPETGWLTYHWSLHLDNLYERLDIEFARLLKNISERLEFETGNVFYTCKNNCARFLFEVAAETDFICPVCCEELFYQDNGGLVQRLSDRITEMEATIRK